MAVTRATLTSGGTSTDATSFATASVSPTADQVVVVTVVNTKSTGVAVPASVTGNGITYTLSASRVAGTRAVSVWWGISASPSAGAITIDFGSDTQTACSWDVEQTTDASPSTPIRQTQTGAASGTTAALDSALSAFQDADSLGLYVVSHAANEATTVDPDWTAIQDLGLGSPAQATHTAYISGGADLSPAPSWTTSSSYVIVAVEVAASPASTGVVAFVA